MWQLYDFVPDGSQKQPCITFNQRVWSSSLQWITIPPALVLTRAGGFSFFRRNERKGPWKGQEGYPGHPVGYGDVKREKPREGEKESGTKRSPSERPAVVPKSEVKEIC